MVIDPKPYQAALDQAKGTLAHDEALLKNAQAEYARYKALFDAGVVSKETLDADEASHGPVPGRDRGRQGRHRDCPVAIGLVHDSVAHRRQDRAAAGRSRQHHYRQYHQSGDHQPVSAHRGLFHPAGEPASPGADDRLRTDKLAGGRLRSRRCRRSWLRTSC